MVEVKVTRKGTRRSHQDNRLVPDLPSILRSLVEEGLHNGSAQGGVPVRPGSMVHQHEVRS